MGARSLGFMNMLFLCYYFYLLTFISTIRLFYYLIHLFVLSGPSHTVVTKFYE